MNIQAKNIFVASLGFFTAGIIDPDYYNDPYCT